MPGWRKIFGCEDEIVTFTTVHARYRKRILEMSEPQDLAGLQRLNDALHQAEIELEEAPGRSRRHHVVYFY